MFFIITVVTFVQTGMVTNVLDCVLIDRISSVYITKKCPACSGAENKDAEDVRKN